MMYHNPVLLTQCIEGLNIQPQGTYVDVTYGGGGHSREILKMLDRGKLFGFDQDQDALPNLIDDERLVLINHNFKFLKNFLKYHEFRGTLCSWEQILLCFYRLAHEFPIRIVLQLYHDNFHI